MTRSAADLVRGSVGVASLPAVYGRLCEAIADPRAGVSRIAEIVASDSGLTARLLRLVNSAFYGFPAKIETVSQAVLLVGTSQIRDLALATSVLQAFRGVPRDVIDMAGFWEHSIATGVAARALATLRRDPGTERFFVAGVLHDLGRLLLYARRPDQTRAALLQSQRTGAPLVDAERELIGVDHAAAGAALAEAWALGPSLTEMIGGHHDPDPAGQYAVETRLVHVADLLVHAMEIGRSGEPAVPPLVVGAWECLELSPAMIPRVAEEVDRQVSEVGRSILGPSQP